MSSVHVHGHEPAEEPAWLRYRRYPVLSDHTESETLVALIRRAQQQQRGQSGSSSSSSDDTEEPWAGTSRSRSRRAPAPAPVPPAAPLSAEAPLSAAAFYVPDLPGRPAGMQLPAMYSGHLPAAYAIARPGSAAAAANTDANAGVGAAISRWRREDKGKGQAQDQDQETPGTTDSDGAPAAVQLGDGAQDGVENDAHLFFLLVKARHIAQREKLVLWFNGGPGCSSFDGALLEIGPVKVQGVGDAAILEDNPGKWNEYANVLFIDQPAGTGYSYINKGQPVAELAPAAEQIVQFLSNFYALFPEYAKMDTYIAGESYAGTTIPYLARAIVSTTSLPTRLEGLLIGNGWFSPADQYPAYVAYGRARGFLSKQNDETRAVARLEKQCNAALNSTEGKGHVLVGTCEGLIDAVMRAGRTTIDTKKYCMGAYDVRPSEFCGEYPNGLQFATPYLQQSDVVEAFHASDKHAKWAQCNNTVGSQMWSPRSRPSVELLPDLLEQMPMLLFAGDADLMCSWIGIENMLNNLTWRGETGFGDAVEEEWAVNGTVAGTWRTARNMTWVKVANAGHMVPINQPYAAQDILLRFLGIDTLIAAGDGSQIPSRIGRVSSGVEAVIGKVAPDGGTLPAVISQQEKQAAAAASSAAAAVDFYAEEGQPIDKERELLYGPRRSAVLMLIIVAVALAFYALLRWRARKRRAAGWTPKRYMPPGSGRSGLGTPAGSGTYRFNRLSLSLSSSAPNTPVRGGGSRRKRERESLQLSEMNLLKRIEEHELELEDGPDAEVERQKLDSSASRSIFALEGEDGSYEDLADTSLESGQPLKGGERAQ